MVLSNGNKARSESLKMKAAGGWDILTDAFKNYSANGDANQAAAIALRKDSLAFLSSASREWAKPSAT